MSSEPGQPRLSPRLSGFVLIAVGVVALMTGTFVLGLLVRGDDDQAYDNSTREVVATATAELRPEPVLTLDGIARGGATIEVLAARPEGADIAQVSSAPLAVGASVAPGAIVTAVSGRPVFALLIPGPYYRDLQLYDEGADVLALNAALAALGLCADAASDEYGWDTAAAVADLYDGAGFTPLRATPEPDISAPAAPPTVMPRGSLLPFAEVAPLPSPAMVVAESAALLTVLEEGAVVARLTSAVTQVVVRANAVDVREVALHQAVEIVVPGRAEDSVIPGHVAAISDFVDASPDDPSRGAGYDINIAIDDGAAALASDAVVTVRFATVGDEFVAVPTTALQQDGDGAFVWRRGPDGFERVDVVVRRIADGWTFVEPGSDLREGDVVRVG